MISGLKPYPEYKDSGLPWLGQVQGHWDVRSIGSFCSWSHGQQLVGRN